MIPLILGAAFLVGLTCLFAISLRSSEETYIDEYGYVVIAATKELQHRSIAKNLLGRDLKSNEVVHHINGRKTDNHPGNLCLMDRQKHEHFHSWLRWKKEKNQRYPSLTSQKQTLEAEYGGTLLENVRAILPTVSADDETRRKLFVALRDERSRIAEERNIRAYEIFHDSVLNQIADKMPDSKHSMLGIEGLDVEKYEAFGRYFIAVVWRFRADNRTEVRGKRKPA